MSPCRQKRAGHAQFDLWIVFARHEEAAEGLAPQFWCVFAEGVVNAVPERIMAVSSSNFLVRRESFSL